MDNINNQQENDSENNCTASEEKSQAVTATKVKGNRNPYVMFIVIGVVIGIVLTCVITGAILLGTSKSSKTSVSVSSVPVSKDGDETPSENETANETTNETTNENETPNENETDKQSSSPEQTTAVGANEWNAQTTYQSGDKASYQGILYEAKWWTQNETPSEGDASPWKSLGKVEEPKKKEEKQTKGEDNMESNLPVTKPTGNRDKGFRVLGYYPDWEPDKMDRLQMDLMTHINYAFAIPKTDGTLMPLDHPETAKKLIKLGHQHDVKILVAVGGWSYNDIPLETTFKDATSTDAKIDSLVKSIVDMIKDYGFDGADIDWEHPRFGDITQTQYEKFILKLSTALKKDDLLLTISVLSGVSADNTVMYDAAAHTDKVLAAADWVNIMAYDGGDGDRHSTYDFHVNCGKYWIENRKVPKDKIVVGVPFYGRPSWSTYDAILEVNPDAYKSDISMVRGMEVHYNGVDTIAKKAKWNKENCGGIMAWELTQDCLDKDKSLMTAIRNAIK